MNEIVSIISTVGFPIACCLGLGYYVFKVTDSNRQELKNVNEKLQEIIEKQVNVSQITQMHFMN